MLMSGRYTVRFMKYSGSGPYMGYYQCSTKAKDVNSGESADQFTWQPSTSCGSGYYAAYVCLGWEWPQWTVRTYQAGYPGGGDPSAGSYHDCTAPYTNWLWSADWQYFK
jgi:hypothetical protein